MFCYLYDMISLIQQTGGKNMNLTLVLEVIGTVAFSISGAVMAIKKGADIFGVVFLAVTTAVGGGMIRDVILGNQPPSIFNNGSFVTLSICVAIAVFFVALANKEEFELRVRRIDRLNNAFDGLGLGVFTVTGINTTMLAGYADNAFMVLFLGMLTGVGGGIIRDTFINEIPSVLRKHVYAVASLVGGLLYYWLVTIGLDQVSSATLSISLVFIIRILSAKFDWNLPTVFKNE